MPQTKPSPNPPKKRRLLWILSAAIVLLAGAVAYFLIGTTPVPQPASETSEATAPLSRHIYSETADPKADIAAALAKAQRENKRVILDFGGDWCGDCQVLDIYFHQPPNAGLLASNFVLVHVWIGHEDANLDVAARYGVPMDKGVPALAVLSPAGSVLYAQQSGEFERMRQMDPASVTEFLNKWKG